MRKIKVSSGGCSSMVEQKPSKLTTRVRFPSPAPVNNRNTAPNENNNRVVEKSVDARREREDSTQRYGEREQQSRHGLIGDHEAHVAQW